VDREVKRSVDEQRVKALEIGICHVDRLRHTDKSVTQLFARHAERHDVGAIAIARVVVVQPPCLP
jgi:hypothetical protein